MQIRCIKGGDTKLHKTLVGLENNFLDTMYVYCIPSV